MKLSWTDFKTFIAQRNAPIQYVDVANYYWLYAFDQPFQVECLISKDGSAEVDVTDFETNYKSNSNKPISSIVTTQFELNNKDLKLAKGTATVDASSKTAIVSVQIPGTFGSGDGRYVAGGYAISGDYKPDDYVTVRVEDIDRLLALAIAQSQNPNATQPLSDQAIQSMGVIPGLGAFPNYPIVKSYTDDDLSAVNQGWFFWPLAQGNNLPPVGECEVEPIGGYGFLPSGFYLKIVYYRSVTIGNLQVNFYWGKLE